MRHTRPNRRLDLKHRAVMMIIQVAHITYHLAF